MRHCDKNCVTVNVTNLCNLRCSYCMANTADEQSHPIFIDKEFAFAGIRDAVMGRPAGIKVNSLRFFGPGEPTQDMGAVVSCVEYARTLMPEIGTELQTNGVFPSVDARDWIANNFDIVWFSLDGPAEVNDSNRPASDGGGRTRYVEENLRVIGEKAEVGVRSTLVGEMVEHQEKLLEYCHSLGVRRLSVNPVIRPIKRGHVGLSEISVTDPMQFARAFVRAFPTAERLGIEFMNSMTANFDEPTEISCRSCLPVPQLNPDGSVSSCDMALYSDTKSELSPFIYGYWNKATKEIDYDAIKIGVLQHHRLGNLPKCRRCPVGKYCAGGCVGRRAYQTGNLEDVLPEICGATIYMAKHLPLGTKRMSYTHP